MQSGGPEAPHAGRRDRRRANRECRVGGNSLASYCGWATKPSRIPRGAGDYSFVCGEMQASAWGRWLGPPHIPPRGGGFLHSLREEKKEEKKEAPPPLEVCVKRR